jgi:uncharacterized glyoxalase superfamily protein PhnB
MPWLRALGSPSGGTGFRAVTIALNCERGDDVDEVCAAGMAAGVKPPEPVVWGGYLSHVADADRHLWEIAHNPYSPNDGAGLMQLLV